MKPPPTFIRVVLIEENQADQRMILELLREAGGGQFIVCANFRNFKEAFEGLRELEGSVDVALLDLFLPDNQGVDVYAWLSALIPEQPVVVLCEAKDEAVAAEAVRRGAEDYLVKSELSGRLLVRCLRYAIDHKRGETELKNFREKTAAQLEERALLFSKMKQRLAETMDELKTARQQTVDQERMRAMDRAAAGIAHDFNNALSPILAHSEWLLRKPELMGDGKTVQKALCDIHESAERCAEMVLRLRDFCRTEDQPLQMETLDLRRVLNEAISTTRPSWKDQAQLRGCEINVKTDLASVPKVKGVREDLVEMFSDLILNAVDAIRSKGMISITLSSPDEGHVDVCVADNGVGPVYENGDVKGSYPAPFRNGLGLGMVYGIAQRHDAEVLLSSWCEGGTSISIRFPVVEEEVAKVLEPEKGRRLESLRILAVDDDPHIRKILELYLKETGHTVELAADAREALSKFKRNRFDLLLTDYSMPMMNGDHLSASVRAADPKIRIVLLTGFGSQLPQGSPLRLEVDSIVGKPFTYEALQRGIVEAMRA